MAAVAFWPILTKFLKQLGISNKGSQREFNENQFLDVVSRLIKSLQQEFSDSTALYTGLEPKLTPLSAAFLVGGTQGH